MNDLEIFVNQVHVLAEGPIWDSRLESLFYVDILNNKFYQKSDLVLEEYILDEYVTSIGLTNDPSIVLLSLYHSVVLYDLKRKKLVKNLGSVENKLDNNRFNDGASDPEGRYWVGSMDMKVESASANLYCYDSINSIIVHKLDGITISNGIGWSSDSKYMFYVDTPKQKIIRFDFCRKSGKISNPIPVIQFSNPNFPDGLCVDSSNNIWCALWDGGKVVGINSAGEIFHEIIVPAPKVTSCTLGGKFGNTMYITTATSEMKPEEVERYPDAGKVFSIELPYKAQKQNLLNLPKEQDR